MPHPHLRERLRLPAFRFYTPPSAAALSGLAARQCRWPLGEVEQDGFAFCGAPCGHHSYCADHRRLALRRRS